MPPIDAPQRTRPPGCSASSARAISGNVANLKCTSATCASHAQPAHRAAQPTSPRLWPGRAGGRASTWRSLSSVKPFRGSHGSVATRLPDNVADDRSDPDPPRRDRLERAGPLPGSDRRAAECARPAQAACMAERLAQEAIDAFYCSDLLRTRQTAEPAALQARAAGIARRRPARAALRRSRRPEFRGGAGATIRSCSPSGCATTPTTRCPRARACAASTPAWSVRCDRWRSRHEGPTLAVVTHGGVLDMLYRTVHGLPLHGPRTCAIPNTGLNRLRVTGQRFEIVSWADDAHLDGLLG